MHAQKAVFAVFAIVDVLVGTATMRCCAGSLVEAGAIVLAVCGVCPSVVFLLYLLYYLLATLTLAKSFKIPHSVSGGMGWSSDIMWFIVVSRPGDRLSSSLSATFFCWVVASP